MGRAGCFAIVLGAMLLAACGGDDRPSGGPGQVRPAQPAASWAPGMLLVDWSGQSPPVSGALRPVDPATGSDLPGYRPLDVGNAVEAAVSPDGRLLAATGYKASNSSLGEPRFFSSLGELRFFSLDRWGEGFQLEDPAGEPVLFAGPAYLTWSPDNSRLFFITTESDRSLWQRLWAVDVKAREARALLDLDFWTQRLHLSPDGKTVYLFGFPEPDSETGVAIGDAFLAVVNADTGSIEAKIALPGVLAGFRREQGENGEVYAGYWPGAAMSPDGSRYYVAHAEEDRITVVNLRTLEVERSAKVTKQKSALERAGRSLLGLLVRTAEAKGGPFFRKDALVSPDGRWLYVTGSSSDLCTEEEEQPCEMEKPVGLKVINTHSLREAQSEEGIGSIALSPDGRWLLGVGWWYVADGESNSMTLKGQGLKIMDATSHQVVSSIGPEVAYQQIAVSADGRYVHLVSEGPGLREAMHKQYQCSEACWVLSVVELGSNNVVAERPLYGAVQLIRAWGETRGG